MPTEDHPDQPDRPAPDEAPRDEPPRDEPPSRPRGPRPARGGADRRRAWLLGPSSTRRAVILALVVCALALSVAVPLRNYLGQRSELAEMQQQQERLREQVDELERRKAQLQDPAQVEAEARRRLRYVRPGETPYIVQLPGSAATPAPATGDEQPQPWSSDLWPSAEPGSAPGPGTGP